MAWLLGVSLAQRGMSAQDVALEVGCIFSVSLLSALWNNQADQEADDHNQRALTHAHLPAMAYWAMLGGAWLGMIVTAFLHRPALVFILAVLPLGILYNKYKWSGRPFGSLVTYGLYYQSFPILFGFGTLFSPLGWLVALAFGVLRFGNGMYKDIPDAKGDAHAGRRTFYLAFGDLAVRRASLLCWWVGSGMLLVALAVFSEPIVWGGALFVTAVSIPARVRLSRGHPHTNSFLG